MTLSHVLFNSTTRGGLPARALASGFEAIIFDKDGTLLDFAASWNPAIYAGICEIAGDDVALRERIASTLGFDMMARQPMLDAPIPRTKSTVPLPVESQCRKVNLPWSLE